MTKPLYTKIKILTAFLLTVSFPAHAEEENKIFLPEFTVTETEQMENTGNSEISGDLLEKLPLSNSSMTEVLKIKPSVRFSNEENQALEGGEILPDDISISGGRFYDNNFNLDGLRIDSFLDPASGNPKSVTEVPGYSTKIFPDLNIIKSLKIYENDIPAKYGAFTGGVVSAETKKPSDKFKGEFKFLTTRSEWTSFNLKGPLANEFENSRSERMQPDFEKYNTSLYAEGPVTKNSGYIFSYRNNYSQIPLYHLDYVKNQEREMNSLFVKFNHEELIGKSSSASLSYTPYQANYFMPDAINSDYTLNGGGLNLSAENSFELKNSDLSVKSSFSQSSYDREANKNWYKWSATGSKDWGLLTDSNTSKEGGSGDIEKQENTFNLTTDIEYYKSNLYKDIFHRPSAGVFYTYVTGEEARSSTTYVYSSPVTDNPDFTAPLNDDASVPGEQYFSKRLVYFPYSGRQDLNYYGFYLEDIFYVKRFSIRTGIRISRDDFLENINTAPRITASYDFFGNGALSFHSGYNRYYGHSFLQHKLREARGKTYRIEWRSTYLNQLTPWTEDIDSPDKIYRYSDLDTPYADEYSTGIKAEILNTDFHLKYIKKYFEDEFATGYGSNEEELTVYEYNNSASSEYECVSFSVEKKKENDYAVLFNVSWQDRVSFTDTYNSTSDEETASELVYYEGKVIFKDKMPASDYNQPVTANLIIYKRLFTDLDLTLSAKYIKDYQIITPTGDYHEITTSSKINPVTGDPYTEDIPVYENRTKDNLLSFSLRSEIPVFRHKRYKAKLLFNIMNIFNNTNNESSLSSIPVSGRQFFAGMKFVF